MQSALHCVRQVWSHFRDSRAGSVAIAFSLAAPVVVALGATAVEFSLISNHRSQLQSAVDAGTLAATQELSLSNASEGTVERVVETVVQTHMADTPNSPSLQSRVDRNAMTVSVNARMDVALAFGSLFGMDSITIGATATGQALGQPNVCVLAMHRSSSETILLDSNALLTGNGCAVFSNSTSSSGMQSLSNSVLRASTICSAGGYRGGRSNFFPPPFVDCPRFDDPLSHRSPPQYGGCSYTDREVIDRRTTLSPGVYCGGLFIDGNSDVRLSPGIYVIADGEFRVDSNSVVTGEGVGFYLAGRNSRFVFSSNAVVNLEAPTSGDLAGLLFFSDRNQSGDVRNEIFSNYARNMVGTVYLPKAELIIDADNPIADQSAYTAIVVNRLHLTSGPNLVLNTNYDETAVPVPDGIRGAGQPIRLIQ